MKNILAVLIVLATCSLAFAQFDEDEEDEWADFDYANIGLTQAEFQKVKDSEMTKEKLLELIEIGVKPAQYLNKPWENLGVTEEEWLKQRSKGMDDNDIDRTYKNASGNQGLAYLSFLVPSLYHWNTDDYTTAIAIDIVWVTSLSIAIWQNVDGSNNWWYWLIGVGGAHLWSGLHAVISTQWDNNPEATRFSWGITPTGKNSFAAYTSIKF